MVGDGLEAILAPAALKRANLMAPANRQAFLCPVGVEDHIIGRMFGKLPLAVHR